MFLIVSLAQTKFFYLNHNSTVNSFTMYSIIKKDADFSMKQHKRLARIWGNTNDDIRIPFKLLYILWFRHSTYVRYTHF
jgi:hypothetical protein